MGVRKLETFMKNLQDGYKKIDIFAEIDQFKADNENVEPTIIIDVNSITYVLCSSNYESVLGASNRQSIEIMTKFFDVLKKRGVKMIFVCDGPLMDSRIGVWCKRRATEFDEKKKILSDIDQNKYETFRTGDMNSKGFNFNNSLLKVARVFGTVIVATERDCDAIVAHQASERNALAVISPDTDFIIYEGIWDQWIVDRIKVDESGGINVTAHCYNRSKLISHLRLNREQMKIFATVAGNDYTKPFYFMEAKRIGVRDKHFDVIAKFCRECKTKFDDVLYQRIANFIYDNQVDPNPKESINMIKTSILSYSIDFELQPKEDNHLEMYKSENALIYSILNEKTFQYNVNFMEFKGEFLNRIFITLRRISGVLLYERKRENPTFKLLTKRSLEGDYDLTGEIPVFPEKKKALHLTKLFSENKDLNEKRWKLLLWCLDFDEQSAGDSLHIPDQYRMIALALKFMLKTGACSQQHADALMITEYMMRNKNPDAVDIPTPERLDGTIVRAVHSYDMAIRLIWDCLYACGLKDLVDHSYFSGFLFHDLCVNLGKREDYLHADDDMRRVCSYYTDY